MNTWNDVKAAMEKLDANAGAAVRSLLDEHKALAENYEYLEERVAEMELRAKTLGKGGAQGAELKNFNAYLHTNKLEHLQTKDVTIAGGESAGSGMVPTQIAGEILSKAVDEEPILREVRVTPASTGDYRRVTNRKGTTSGWSGETDTRNQTDTSRFRNIEPPGGELYARPVASDWAVQDMLFDVAGIVIDDAGEEFGIQQADSLFFGNGTNKPLGMLNSTPVTTADTTPDTRDKDTLRYVTSTGSPNALDADLLITALFDLKASYRRNAIWCMNSFTLGQVRSLKDSNGRYIWESGGFGGGIDAPDGLLLGKRVVVSERLQNVGAGAGNFPILVGDFRRGYEMVKVGGMRITLDNNITTPGFVKWFIRQRFLGRLTDNNAIRAIRT